MPADDHPTSLYGRFGLLRKNYAHGRRGFPDLIYQSILQRLKENPLILDLGCGTGISTRQMAERCTRVIGCDPDEDMLQQASMNPDSPLWYVIGRAEAIPFPQSTFDAVTCFSSFHWFDASAAFSEVRRVLKPYGLLAIVNKNDVGAAKSAFRDLVSNYVNEELPNAKKDYNPQLLMESHGFLQIEHSSICATDQYQLEDAIEYFQSVSLWNLIPRHQKSRANKELRAFCQKRLVSGYFSRRLSIDVTIGRKNLQ